MTDTEKLKSALAKLDHGGWSLTVGGFARRALKMKAPLTVPDKRTARKAMVDLFGEPRRVPYGAEKIEVWDYQKT